MERLTEPALRPQDRSPTSLEPRPVAGLRSLLFWLFATGLVLTTCFVALGMPPPGADDSWFKGPAATLAATGHLASPGLTGFFPRSHEVYASYPPLPQYLLASVYRVFGITRRVSISWDLLVHLAGTLAIAATALRVAQGNAVDPKVRWWAAFAVGLIWLPGHRTLDRQEGLGLLFVWLDLWVIGHPAGGSPALRAAASGVFAGLASLAAPWAGVLGGGTIAARAFASAWDGTEDDPVPRTAKAFARAVPIVCAGAVTTAAVFVAWVGWIEFQYPGVFNEQFLGAMRAAAGWEPHATLQLWLSLVRRSLFAEATLLPGLVLAALWFPLSALSLPPADGVQAHQARRLAQVLYAVGLFALVLGAIWRPTAYTYFWASAAILMPCLVVVLARFAHDSQRAGRVIATSLVLVAWFAVALTVFWTLREDPRGRLDGSFRALQEIVPPDECVATTTSHWMAFQGRNPWLDALWLYKRDPSLLDDCDWLVLRTGVGQDLPESILGDFDLVEELEANSPVQVTYAWAVYHRRP